MKFLIWVTFLSNVCVAFAQSPSADEILTRFDRTEISATSHSIGTITVKDRFGDKVSAFEAYAQGNEKSLIVFTAGDEKGQRILRLKDTIYVSYPEADKPVKIQGSALRDSVAGSDLSYEDMAGDQSLSSRYNARLLGKETIRDESCFVLELAAKRPGLAYPNLKLWIGEKDFSGRRIEKYSQNNRLLKTQDVLAVKQIGDKIVPTEFKMVDHLKGRSETSFVLKQVELDVKVDVKKFSLEELTW